MRLQYFILPALFFLLTACGNSNNGKSLTPYKRTLAYTQTTSNNTQTITQLDYCKTFAGYDGSNGASGILFSSASVCKIKNTPAVVHIKVSSNFPVNGRYCLVPMNTTAFRESCFSIDGQADIALDASVLAYGYGSIAIVAEGDMAAYRSYLNLQSGLSPARGIAFMNQ